MRRNPPRPLASLMRKSEKIDKALAMVLLQLGYFSCLTPRLGLEWREMFYTVLGTYIHCTAMYYYSGLPSCSIELIRPCWENTKLVCLVSDSDGSGPTRYVVGTTRYYIVQKEGGRNHIPPTTTRQKEKVGLAHLHTFLHYYTLISLDNRQIFCYDFCFVFGIMLSSSSFLVSEEIFFCQLKQMTAAAVQRPCHQIYQGLFWLYQAVLKAAKSKAKWAAVRYCQSRESNALTVSGM